MIYLEERNEEGNKEGNEEGENGEKEGMYFYESEYYILIISLIHDFE